LVSDPIFAITPLRVGDETSLQALYEPVADNSGQGPTLTFLAGLLKSPQCRAWAVSDRDIPVGAIWYQCVAPEAELIDLRILPAYRRRGHATRLIRETLHTLATAKISRVDLEVRESNVPARQLYAAHGFAMTGRRRKYYPSSSGREDAILMSLALSSREASQ